MNHKNHCLDGSGTIFHVEVCVHTLECILATKQCLQKFNLSDFIVMLQWLDCRVVIVSGQYAPIIDDELEH